MVLNISMREAREIIAVKMQLSAEDLAELLPSGTQTKFDNRAAWAKSYFVQAKVLTTPRRGSFVITERGKDLHRQGHERIDIGVLRQYQEFIDFQAPGRTTIRMDVVGSETSSDGDATPEEVLQQAYQSIRGDLVSEIIAKVKSNSPKFFENLVVDLMVSMGYGGSSRLLKLK